MKGFESIIYVCAVLILIFAITLIYLNWNPEIRTKLFSGFLIGTFTIFSLIYWGLEESIILNSFRSSVAINKSTNLPLFEVDLKGNSKLLQRQTDLSTIGGANMVHDLDEKEVILFEEPKSFDEGKKITQELLQYLILKYISQASEPISPNSVRITQGGDFITENKVYLPYLPSKIAKLDSADVHNVNGNVFFGHPGEKFYWDHHSFTVPVGTKIELKKQDLLGSPDLEKYLVYITKNNYFEVVISITQSFSSPDHSYKEFNSTHQDRNNIGTQSYLIETKSKFNKFTSKGLESDEYKKWVESTLNFIMLKLDDNSMIQ